MTEENKIPVDCIAGTSFGAMVGGFYAIGTTPAEMRVLTHSEPWDAFLSGEPYYSDLTFRRKEDRHDFPIKLEVGLKNGLKLPSGNDIAPLRWRAAWILVTPGASPTFLRA